MRTSWISLMLAAALAVAPAAAQNLLLGANFDDNGDVPEWDLDAGLSLNWSQADEAGCGNSGSAFGLSENLGGAHTVTVSQCVANTSTQATTWWGRARYKTAGSFTIRIDRFASSTCSGGFLGFESQAFPASAAQWATASVGGLSVPASSDGVRLTVTSVLASPIDLGLDAAFLGPTEPIFLDDFDGNDPGPANSNRPCRWSARVF